MSENHLIFYTSTNQKGRKDATGAFIPEAKRLAKYIKSKGDTAVIAPIATKGATQRQRRRQVENVLEAGTLDYEHIYFLCHGYKNGIQFGYKWESGAKKLVHTILKSNPCIKTITFYCCSVAKDENNFCEWVDNYLSMDSRAMKTQVFGHYTAGHTTMNPNIKIYTDKTDYIWSKNPVKGYEQLIAGDKKAANERMHDIKDPFRFEIPFVKMNQDEPKKNKCKITFECDNQVDCVYKSGDDCKYKNPDLFCESKVARVNAMTLELDKLTGGL